MAHTGRCHCGSLAFELDGDIAEVYDCNCSMCRRRGGLLAFAAADALRETGSGTPQTYRFNTHNIAHHFCRTCGIAPYSRGVGPDGVQMACVNVRCIDGIDLAALKIVQIDGASL